ncbi:toll/interleukin-1 receptor domain-containing protein [Sorangium sp. So ce542]|uniref:toll/interleukin-1 receptor domain-containing protein n=1 Tax=Sorangium sp. So ce542 TaxID=3133316 RepID=UPI003F5DD17D
MKPIERRAKRKSSEPALCLVHSSKDRQAAQQISADLMSCGVDAWTDEWSTETGQRLSEALADATSKFKFIVMLITESHSPSAWADEYKNARSREQTEDESTRIRLLPIKLGAYPAFHHPNRPRIEDQLDEISRKQINGENIILPLILNGNQIPSFIVGNVHIDLRSNIEGDMYDDSSWLAGTNYFNGIALLASMAHMAPACKTLWAIGAFRPHSISEVWSLLRSAGCEPDMLIGSSDFDDLIRCTGTRKIDDNHAVFHPEVIVTDPSSPAHIKSLIRAMMANEWTLCDHSIGEISRGAGRSGNTKTVLVESLKLIASATSDSPDHRLIAAKWFNRLYYDIVKWNDQFIDFLWTYPGFTANPSKHAISRFKSTFKALYFRLNNPEFCERMELLHSRLGQDFAWLRDRQPGAFDALHAVVGEAITLPSRFTNIAKAFFSDIQDILEDWDSKAHAPIQLPEEEVAERIREYVADSTSQLRMIKQLADQLNVHLVPTAEYDDLIRSAKSSDAPDGPIGPGVGRPARRSTMSKKADRPRFFLSYSHRDRRLVEELKSTLAPLVTNGTILAWDDSEIGAGEPWEDRIRDAISSASIALLFVSPHFLASSFITTMELPALLEKHRDGRLTITWICLTSCLHELTDLKHLQALHDPSKPIDQLTKAQRNAQWTKIGQRLMSMLGSETGKDI